MQFLFVFFRIMVDSSGPQKDWYSILGACPTDDIQELKQKYQKLILMVGVQKAVLNFDNKSQY